METKVVNSECFISSLPVELLSLILEQLEVRDVVSFSSTCKDFRDIVQNNQLLWKNIFKPILPIYMFESLEKSADGNWFNIVKDFHYLKQRVYEELYNMSSKCYWQCSDISLEDVRIFFDIALSSNINYFCVIYILQDVVKKSIMHIDRNCSKRPFTMTEMFYAKVALRHLIHTFLAVKWVKNHLKKEFPPEVVINYFLQWVDSHNWYPDTEVDLKINQLAERVKAVLDVEQPRWASHSIRDRIAMKVLHEKQVLTAISKVLYHERNMTITFNVSFETLNIVKALETNVANFITIAAIYHAVANRCFVACDLVSFPNHLFVEWRDLSDARNPVTYTVDLRSGEIHPKRRCPFSNTDRGSTYKYCPDSLLQYVYSIFDSSMNGAKNWYTQNALHLLDFLGTTRSRTNPYRNFLAYLIGHAHLPAMDMPLDITNMQTEHKHLLRSLAHMNSPIKTFRKEFERKKRIGRIKFAVGMVCCHKKVDYVGVIRAWDETCDLNFSNRMEMELNLQFGIKQPFYFLMAEDQSCRYVAQVVLGGLVCCHKKVDYVGRDRRPNFSNRMEMELNLQFGIKQPFYFLMAEDQSCRYVAQENIVEVSHPTRLYGLEDAIAREFTHFDGFAYVPNEIKRSEYPDEAPIVELYRLRCGMRP